MLSPHTYDKKVMQDFIEEIVSYNPEWAKYRRLEFLSAKLIKQMKYYLNFVSKCLEYGIPFDYISLPEKMFKTKREIDTWNKPVGSDISREEIELAKGVNCSQFLEIVRSDGKRKWAKCPFHEEKNPSLCCYEKSGWYCFGCNEGGDAINLIQKLYGYNFKQAVKFINGTY